MTTSSDHGAEGRDPVPGRAPDPTTVPLAVEPSETAARVGVDPEDVAAAAGLPAGCALLVAHRGPHREGRFLLDSDRTSVGRDRAAGIVLDDVTVSRKHAEFVRVADVFEVRDLGSLNGTYVNHLRVDASTLRDGDEVRVGAFRLVYLAHRLAR